MIDFSHKLNSFYSAHVRLTQRAKTDLREKRDRNEERVKKGLIDAERPRPIEFIKQGSFRHGTLVQPPQGHASDKYDIDEGIVFEREERGSARNARKWVADAISSQGRNLDVQIKPRCVRVTYSNGVQCDFPVLSYRKGILLSGIYELSDGDEWVATDPHHIAKWVDDRVQNSSIDKSGHYQLRKMIRLTKYFAKVQAKTNKKKAPSGLILTSLVIEAYRDHESRDDLAFVEILDYLSDIDPDEDVLADGDVVSKFADRSRLDFLKSMSCEALEKFENSSCENALNFIFQHTFFEEDSEESATKSDAFSEGAAYFKKMGDDHRPWRTE